MEVAMVPAVLWSRYGHVQAISQENIKHSKIFLSIHLQQKNDRDRQTDLLLFTNDLRKLCVDNSWVELTTHQQSSLVIFDVAKVCWLGQLHRRRETLTRQQKIWQSPDRKWHQVLGTEYFNITWTLTYELLMKWDVINTAPSWVKLRHTMLLFLMLLSLLSSS